MLHSVKLNRKFLTRSLRGIELPPAAEGRLHLCRKNNKAGARGAGFAIRDELSKNQFVISCER
jgi:hypothetical protein